SRTRHTESAFEASGGADGVLIPRSDSVGSTIARRAIPAIVYSGTSARLAPPRAQRALFGSDDLGTRSLDHMMKVANYGSILLTSTHRVQRPPEIPTSASESVARAMRNTHFKPEAFVRPTKASQTPKPPGVLVRSRAA